MTRREFFSIAVAGLLPATSRAPVTVPVHVIQDGKAKLGPRQLRNFWANVWPEACRDLGRSGIRLDARPAVGEVWRPPGREPMLGGIEHGVLNLILTDTIPMEWDQGRGLSGVTTRYRGFHVCMIALSRAHVNQIPFLSLNTCLHEMLHALLGDIFEDRPGGFWGQAREYRVDCYATGLWLFHDGGGVKKAAQSYVARLRSG
jgi:hypothetical protein